MSNIKFDWDEVMKNSAHVMAQCLTKGEYISTITDLHKKLESYYKSIGKTAPGPSTYRQNVSKRLNSEVSIKTALYQLAGMYEKMTLQMLAEGITVSTDETADKCNWLFVRLKKSAVDYVNMRKHLYFFSHELKKKFSKDIVFISFDNDTIVILCKDNNSRKKLLNFFTTEKIHADLM